MSVIVSLEVRITRIVVRLCAVLTFTACLAHVAPGQEKHFSQFSAPPPMKFVARDERIQLSDARDAKARTRLGIALAEARLLRAESLTSSQQFTAAAAELGNYHGLVEDALRFLGNSEKRNKQRDLYKRLELAVRAHVVRIEAIRRTTPSEYAVNVKAVIDYARSARAEALNAFYGDTVIREDPPEEDNASSSDRKKDAQSDSQHKQP